MKAVLYVALLLVFLSSCRHKHLASASANADDYSYNSSGTSTTSVQASNDSDVTTVVTSTTSSSTGTTVSAGANDSVVTTVSVGGNQAQDTGIYRVTIAFTSNGTGADITAADEFENWIKAQPKNLAYDKYQYGREGETLFCLKLNELSTREQEIFVRDVRTKLADKQLVFVDEYARSKGRKVN